jgi:hypothetical protein
MRRPPVRRDVLQGLALLPLLPWLPALGQGVELATLRLERADGALQLEYALRLMLPRAVEDALQRGVPVYFRVEATLFRSRWYWRDERVAHVSRSWRVAYQPLTSSWRVGLGALYQTFSTLAEALAAVSSSTHWKITDLSQIDPDGRYYVDFDFRLDTTQLPSPLQIGLGGGADWVLRIDRTLRLE